MKGCRGPCSTSDESEFNPDEVTDVIKEREVDDGLVGLKQADAVRLLETLRAEARSLADRELQELRTRQVAEQRRFLTFEQKQKWIMWTRHGQKKIEMLDRHSELEQTVRQKVSQVSPLFNVSAKLQRGRSWMKTVGWVR